MKIIYVAGAFDHPDKIHGVERNIISASEVALRCWAAGWSCISPHKNTSGFQHTLIKHDVWMKGDLEILSRCDAILMLQGWEDSPGARVEEEYARIRGLEIYFYDGTTIPSPSKNKDFCWPRKL
jgi:hypothetical protein